MSELKWYDGPSLESASRVVALAGSYRTDSLLTSYAQFLETQVLGSLTELEKTVVGVEVLQREVNAGGFDTFFEHFSSFAPAARQGLQNISRPEVLRLLTTAETLHPEDFESFDALDQAYFDLGLDLSGDLLLFIVAELGK
ncbi:MAG: DUF4375 domain-containing protein [Shimia sp.]|uniref:DMP19 family protein n=1 Tax=Shimia sp. TaxID=1954381 RepID=UPI003B8B3517